MTTPEATADTTRPQTAARGGILSRQQLSPALKWIEGAEWRTIGPQGWLIGALAVDYQTGNIYVAETTTTIIAVVGTGSDVSGRQPYRILFSSDVEEVTAIAVDPSEG